MKKKMLAIGAMCALLLVFSMGFFMLREEDALPAQEGPRELQHLFQYEQPPLSILLEGEGRDPFTLVRLELDPQRNIVTDSTIAGKEHLPLDTARINGVLSASRNLAFLEVVHESAPDYSAFGLDPPRGRVTLDFGESGIRTILIGDVAPGNIGVYVRLENDPAIYLCPVYTVDNFLLSYLDYLNMSVTPLTGWPMEFYSMTLGGRVRESSGEIVIVAGNDGDFHMELPVRHELDPLTAPGVLYSVFGINAAGIAAVQPSTDDLASLGFDDPWSVVTVVVNDQESFTIYASEPDAGGMIFLYRERIQLLYIAVTHDMHWLDAQFHELMLPFATSPSLEELEGINVSFIEGWDSHIVSFNFELDDEGNISAFQADRLLDLDNFRRFFTTLTSATLEYLEDQSRQPESPVMSFLYRYRSGQERTVSFYTSDIPLRHFIRVDEGRLFLTPSFYIDRVIGDIWKVIADEHVDAL